MVSAIKHGVVLMSVLAVALATLAGLQALWGETIWSNRQNYERQLLAETLHGVTYERLIAVTQEALPIRLASVDIISRWRAQYQQNTVATVVRARVTGYGGEIVFVVAFDRQGRRLQSRIVRHAETPGIADFLTRADGAEQAIDGVSGATITSHAVAAAVREVARWMEYNPAVYEQ